MTKTAVAEVLQLREGQLLSLIRGVRGVKEAVAGFWAIPCGNPQHPAGVTTFTWSTPQHTSFRPLCGCGLSSRELALFVGLPVEAITPPPEFQASTFLPLEEFFASCSASREWLLEPFLSPGTFVLVQAAPKGGKTFFVSWLAVSVALAGHTVLFVEEEGSREVMRDRLKPFVPDGTVIGERLRVAWRRGFKLDSDRMVVALVDWTRRTEAKLVILDPFVALHHGEENDAKFISPLVASIQRLISETGCTVVLVHHTKKGSSWDKSDASDASSADARGSGVLPAAADSIIAIKAVPSSQRRAGEVRFTVENTDTRIAEPFEKRLAVVRLSPGGDSFSWGDTEDARVHPETIDELLTRALVCIPFEPQSITREALRDALRCNKSKLVKAITSGVLRGVLSEKHKEGLSRKLVDQ